MDRSVSLSTDTRTILLLCGHFGLKRGGSKPLTPTEYHRFVRWLEGKRCSLGKLLDSEARDTVRSYRDKEVTAQRLMELLGRDSWLTQALDRWASVGIWVMSEKDPDYPVRLRQRLKAAGAPLLFGAGPRELLNEGGVCIVGSRDSTDAGLAFARHLGGRAADEGLTVISSDMRGVDREAITAALAQSGKVISVVSDSLEKAVSARRNRNALTAGMLVLVTPFAPDTRFSVSNAMRANKYQYTLSDVAVIVETRRHGGVWLGADENRNEGWVPAFVRTGAQMAPGNTALLHLGLLPISEEDVRSSHNLVAQLLERSAKENVAPMAAASPSDAHGVDLYGVFLTELLRFVASEARSETDVMKHFAIERSQARTWLARAYAEGRINKSGSSLRYRR
jgi:predicted Rossmann fold nucleotide-binding protein DprA/Smf involved in DNA uptake